jgi:tetratricopeptide (TPR) repeat protein
MVDSQDLLQHPRRNLGNRYRSSAQKFANLAQKDPDRARENYAWAEQNARQAILHDFTDERNWRCLAELKVANNDGEGLHAVMEDVFSILGRDPEHLDQLKGIDFLAVGRELLEEAFSRDPLDPDSWWSLITESENKQEGSSAFSITLSEFSERCKRLDFRDQRANIVFGRRLERIRNSGDENLFIELARHLLAHRPNNHELWMEMGRLHERREEIDDAWSCYDHVQQLRPHLEVRDQFLTRLKGNMDGEDSTPWSGPSVTHRNSFLEGMVALTKRVSTPDPIVDEKADEEEVVVHLDKVRLDALVDAEDYQQAFFMARRLVANGEDWAEEILREIQLKM